MKMCAKGADQSLFVRDLAAPLLLFPESDELFI